MSGKSDIEMEFSEYSTTSKIKFLIETIAFIGGSIVVLLTFLQFRMIKEDFDLSHRPIVFPQKPIVDLVEGAFIANFPVINTGVIGDVHKIISYYQAVPLIGVK